MWVIGRFEDWDDDFRWSPESPPVKAKLYRRRIDPEFDGGVEIIWRDLQDFTVIGAVSSLSSVSALLTILIITDLF